MRQEEIILASASPRRRELFTLFKLPFRCISADLNENQLPNEAPTNYVARLALEKGKTINTDALVLSADTIVVFEGEVLGKPANDDEAREMLVRMYGKSHSVFTALALRQESTGLLLQDICDTQVLMRCYTDTEIESYIQSDDYRDKAGGYAIQHKGFHPVAAVQGCYANVMGLPLCNLACLLQKAGIAVEVDIPEACQRHLGITCEVYPQILARCPQVSQASQQDSR
jgi:MAF protein